MERWLTGDDSSSTERSNTKSSTSKAWGGGGTKKTFDGESSSVQSAAVDKFPQLHGLHARFYKDSAAGNSPSRTWELIFLLSDRGSLTAPC
ncbi:hypothetical protein Efla_007802 [Eimeria flavescens]